MLENVDTHTYGDKKVDHVIRYCVNHIIGSFFKDESVVIQAQMLKSILTSMKSKAAVALLGIRKSTKDTKIKETVIKNMNSALKSIGISRKRSDLDARRAIKMPVVSSSTKENILVKSMAQALGTSRKNLHKHRKFWLKIDVNDEIACWTTICRQPYKDKLGENVKKIMYEYWMKNSRVSPKARDVMRRRITWN